MSKTPDLGSLLLAEEEGDGVVFLERGARKGCCCAAEEEEEGGRGAGAGGVGACSLFSVVWSNEHLHLATQVCEFILIVVKQNVRYKIKKVRKKERKKERKKKALRLHLI